MNKKRRSPRVYSLSAPEPTLTSVLRTLYCAGMCCLGCTLIFMGATTLVGADVVKAPEPASEKGVTDPESASKDGVTEPKESGKKTPEGLGPKGRVNLERLPGRLPGIIAGRLPQAAFGFGLPEGTSGGNGSAPGSPDLQAEPLDADYDDWLMRFGTGNMMMFIEGAFGALVMVVAGLGALIAAAVGNYKMAMSLLVVAVGAFILRALVSLFFGTDYPAYFSGGTTTIGVGGDAIVVPGGVVPQSPGVVGVLQ